MDARRLPPPQFNERRGDHVWTEGDRDSPVPALRLNFWSYQPISAPKAAPKETPP
jgi:hypothetical protein